jgi:hypothetical protein
VSYGDWHVRDRTRWLWGLLTAILLLALAALAVAAFIATIDGNGYALVVLMLALAGAYLSGRACARLPNVALSIDAEQVTITGPIRTSRILIRHVDGFTAELRPSLLGSQPTIVLRHDGYRSVPLWLFTRYGSAARAGELVHELSRTVEELDEALAKAQAAGTPSSIST